MHVVTLLLALSVAPSASVEGLDAFPHEVSGAARGLAGVRSDPAAPAFAGTGELELRLQSETDLPSALGAYGVLPMGRLALAGGYEWLALDGSAPLDPWLVSLSSRLGDDLALGVSVRGARMHLVGGRPESVWSAGLRGEPWSWLALSAGVDGFNRPRDASVAAPMALRGGIGLRPLVGASALTLGVDTALVLDDGEPLETRLFAELWLRGVGLQARYDLEREQLVVGLSLSLGQAEVGAATARRGSGGDSVGVLATRLSVRGRASESVLAPGPSRVEVVLRGNLVSEPAWPWSAREQVSRVELELRRLAQASHVTEVVLVIGRLETGLAHVTELREAVHALRAAGKRVVAEISNARELEYFIAAACDEIRIDPAGLLTIDGFAMSVGYYAKALAKLGVRFDSVEVGRYKTGPDPLVLERPRAEEDEVRREIMDAAYARLEKTLREDRKLDPAAIEKIVATAVFTPKDALEHHLVDGFTLDPDPTKVPTQREAVASAAELVRLDPRWSSAPSVLVIPIVGAIVKSAGDNPLPGPAATAEQLVPLIEAAREERDVRAVVLRIDSPGGEIVASELIWRAVRRLAEAKPVVVSMGEVAASGGYYVAAPAHLIFAQPHTITGSIGIFQVKLDLSRLYDLLGVHNALYKRGDKADASSSDRGFTPEERVRLEQILRQLYDDFVGKVAVGRKLELEQARAAAEGRVYLGERALQLKLVDRIGSLADAIDAAKERAGFSEEDRVAVRFAKGSSSLGAVLTDGVRVGPVAGFAELGAEALTRLTLWDGVPLALLPQWLDLGP